MLDATDFHGDFPVRVLGKLERLNMRIDAHWRIWYPAKGRARC
jgi:hypothetical protein